MKSIAALILSLTACSAVFGQSSAQLFDQPVRADQYIIRPGDELTVTFLKANIESLKLIVDPEGRIVHSNLGIFDLSHQTLAEAKDILSVALKNLYKVENIVISINDPLLVRYSVSGAVDSPGVYQDFSSLRVSDAIAKAGGVLPDGSTRRILFTGGPKDLLVDLDLAVSKGDWDANPCLYAGYSIHVPQKSGNRVQIVGEVNQPREIELLDGDEIGLLITLAGGFRSWADSNNTQIIRDGNVLNAKHEGIKPGDIIKINPLPDLPLLSNVTVFGAVMKPGKFLFKSGLTLGNLMTQTGGFAVQAVKERTTVFRLNPFDAGGRISTTRFPIQNVLVGGASSSDFRISPGDSVFVPYLVGYVVVAGYVANPGSFPYVSEKSANYYINLAGGFLADADRQQIQLFDPITKMTSSLSPAVHVNDGATIIVNIRKEIR